MGMREEIRRYALKHIGSDQSEAMAGLMERVDSLRDEPREADLPTLIAEFGGELARAQWQAIVDKLVDYAIEEEIVEQIRKVHREMQANG